MGETAFAGSRARSLSVASRRRRICKMRRTIRRISCCSSERRLGGDALELGRDWRLEVECIQQRISLLSAKAKCRNATTSTPKLFRRNPHVAASRGAGTAAGFCLLCFFLKILTAKSLRPGRPSLPLENDWPPKNAQQQIRRRSQPPPRSLGVGCRCLRASHKHPNCTMGGSHWERRETATRLRFANGGCSLTAPPTA